MRDEINKELEDPKLRELYQIKWHYKIFYKIMGNNIPKDASFEYQIINKLGTISITYEDLKGNFTFPKMPNKKTVVLEEFRKFLDEIILLPSDKHIIE